MEYIQRILNHVLNLPVWLILVVGVLAMVICYLKGHHDGIEEMQHMDDWYLKGYTDAMHDKESDILNE